MKKWQIFGIGFAAGIGVTILVLVIVSLAITSNGSGGLIGANMFDKPGAVFPDRSFKVLQVVNDNAALAHGKHHSLDAYVGTLYLIMNDEGKYYYDDEIINVPQGKKARQVGIYQYNAKSGVEKTVPIIKIMD